MGFKPLDCDLGFRFICAGLTNLSVPDQLSLGLADPFINVSGCLSGGISHFPKA